MFNAMLWRRSRPHLAILTRVLARAVTPDEVVGVMETGRLRPVRQNSSRGGLRSGSPRLPLTYHGLTSQPLNLCNGRWAISRSESPQSYGHLARLAGRYAMNLLCYCRLYTY